MHFDHPSPASAATYLAFTFLRCAAVGRTPRTRGRAFANGRLRPRRAGISRIGGASEPALAEESVARAGRV